MAIESTNHAPEYPVAKDTTQNDIAGSHLLASAYGEQSFAPPSERRESSSENGIQVASALSAGIWTGLQRDAQRDGGTMTDASPEQPEVILAGLTGKLYVGKLRDAANDAVNRTDLGNVVPRNARNYAGEKVPPSNQCASTLSDLLINAGLITSRDYQIRVTDMVGLLNGKVGRPEVLSGKFDKSDFRDGSIGIIAGMGHSRNGSNHIAIVERHGDKVSIIHNNGGRVVRQDITDKFYYRDGSPRYSDMRLFKLK